MKTEVQKKQNTSFISYNLQRFYFTLYSQFTIFTLIFFDEYLNNLTNLSIYFKNKFLLTLY